LKIEVKLAYILVSVNIILLSIMAVQNYFKFCSLCTQIPYIHVESYLVEAMGIVCLIIMLIFIKLQPIIPILLSILGATFGYFKHIVKK